MRSGSGPPPSSPSTTPRGGSRPRSTPSGWTGSGRRAPGATYSRCSRPARCLPPGPAIRSLGPARGPHLLVDRPAPVGRSRRRTGALAGRSRGPARGHCGDARAGVPRRAPGPCVRPEPASPARDVGLPRAALTEEMPAAPLTSLRMRRRTSANRRDCITGSVDVRTCGARPYRPVTLWHGVLLDGVEGRRPPGVATGGTSLRRPPRARVRVSRQPGRTATRPASAATVPQ